MAGEDRFQKGGLEMRDSGLKILRGFGAVIQQRKIVRVLGLSKSAISLQSLNVNYRVLP
jgi:hypothetical protein